MKRLTTALLAALDALIVVAIGVGIALVPLTILWATQFGLAVNWLVFWRAAVDVWLVGNGVDLVVQLHPALVAALNLPGADAAFPITIALLGFALMAVLFGLRTGRRAAETPHRWVGVAGAIISYTLLTALLVLSAGTDAVRPVAAQGLLLPPLIFAAGVLIGAAQGQLGRLLGSIPGLTGRLPGVFRGQGRNSAASGSTSSSSNSSSSNSNSNTAGTSWSSSNTAGTSWSVRGSGSSNTSATSAASATTSRGPGTALGLLPIGARPGVAAALRGGTAAAAGILFVAGITVFVLILANYATIIGLYETVQAGILGGVALTLLQLALIPNLVIWAAAWFVGPGIAVGVGTSVSPVGTSLGTVPGLPLLGVLPQGSLAFGFVGLLVPLLVGFLAAVILRQRTGTDVPPPTLTERLLTGLGTGVVAGVLLGLLAWWSGGALGPGRLVEVGPNPLLVGALAAALVGFAACLGLLTPAPPVSAHRSGPDGATSAKPGTTPGTTPGTKPGTTPGTASRAVRSASNGAGRLLGRLRDALPRR